MYRLVAAVIFKISHGRDIQDPDDAFVKLVETTNEDFALSVRPFVYLVDSLPFCEAPHSLTDTRY